MSKRGKKKKKKKRKVKPKPRRGPSKEVRKLRRELKKAEREAEREKEKVARKYRAELRDLREEVDALKKPKRKPRKKPKVEPLFRIPVVLGVGGGGCRMVAQIDTKPYGATKIAISNSRSDLEAVTAVHQKIVAGDGRGSGTDPNKGRQDFKTVSASIPMIIRINCEKRGFSWPDVIPVIATPGHGFASGAVPELVKGLLRHFKDSLIMLFATTPFDWEGSDTRRKAWECLRKVKGLGVPFVQVSNQIAVEKMNINVESLGLWETYDVINKSIANTLNRMFVGLTATKFLRSTADPADVRAVWKPDLVVVGSTSYSGADHVGAGTIDDCLETAYSRVEIGPVGGWLRKSYPRVEVGYMIHANAEVMVGQIRGMNQRIQELFKIDIAELKPLMIEDPMKTSTDVVLMLGGIPLA